jgi:hypothetical protein
MVLTKTSKNDSYLQRCRGKLSTKWSKGGALLDAVKFSLVAGLGFVIYQNITLSLSTRSHIVTQERPCAVFVPLQYPRSPRAMFSKVVGVLAFLQASRKEFEAKVATVAGAAAGNKRRPKQVKKKGRVVKKKETKQGKYQEKTEPSISSPFPLYEDVAAKDAEVVFDNNNVDQGAGGSNYYFGLAADGLPFAPMPSPPPPAACPPPSPPPLAAVEEDDVEDLRTDLDRLLDTL